MPMPSLIVRIEALLNKLIVIAVAELVLSELSITEIKSKGWRRKLLGNKKGHTYK